MAYELFIYPGDGTPATLTSARVIEGFAQAGVACVEEPDKYGHWLVLAGYESALDLTIKDGLVTGAGFRLASVDDPLVIEKVAEVFKGLGWIVSDDEGEL